MGDPLSSYPLATTNQQRPVRRIAVLGGGISGLSAAYFLAQARRGGAPIEELLIEARGRVGGSIQTERVEGFLIEGGPDSFLTEKPEAGALCRALGLGDSLLGSNDAARRTFILHHGRLVPLPDGLMLLVPTRVWPMLPRRCCLYGLSWPWRPSSSPGRREPRTARPTMSLSPASWEDTSAMP